MISYLQVDNLSKRFGEQLLFENISFGIGKGQKVALIAKNGMGKSTLLRIIAGKDTSESGTVIFRNDITVGILDQDPALDPENSVFEEVFHSDSPVLKLIKAYEEAVAHNHTEALEKLIPEMDIHSAWDYDTTIKQILSELKIDTYDKKIGQLSGGQKQRVGIARALTTTPDILLCDEATSALDPQTTESILKLLKKINREMGVTILLITHQMQVVQMICNKVAVMENGQVVEAGSVLDVFGKPQAPVTRRFVQTVVNDQIPESILSLVKEQKEHFRVERLKFIGSSVKRPVISDICHVDGIVVNILGATVQELQENVMCVFILQLIGTEEKILEAEKQIDENGVIRERVEAI